MSISFSPSYTSQRFVKFSGEDEEVLEQAKRDLQEIMDSTDNDDIRKEAANAQAELDNSYTEYKRNKNKSDD